MTEMIPNGFWYLMYANPLIAREVEEGRYETHKTYVPTDWSKTTPAEAREFWGGLDERNGYCEKCYMLRTIAGGCFCQEIEMNPLTEMKKEN